MVLCHFFGKYEHFLACKKNIVKHIFRDSEIWSKVIHSNLQIPK
jgi:hypothetical protein